MASVRQNLFHCQDQACIAKFTEMTNIECKSQESVDDMVFHCACHDISRTEEGGALCVSCHVWVCVSCKRELEMYNGIINTYCSKCEEVILLRRHPRPNFVPDAPVEVEYAFINPMNKKRKLVSDPMADISLQKTKTLLELSFLPWPEFKLDALALQNPHPLDDSIWLDETHGRHVYHVQYVKDGPFETENNMSTSAVAHKYSKPYDKYDAVEKMLMGREWGPKHPKWGKYFHTDETILAHNLQEMLKEWTANNKNGLQLGKFVHMLLEAHLNNAIDLLTHPVYSKHKQIQQFLKWKYTKFDAQYIPYRTEFRFHSDASMRRVGTCDLIAVKKDHPPPDQCNSTLTGILIDWKNTILKQAYRNETMQGPCSSIPQCNVGEYCVQQNDYCCLARTFYTGWKFNGYVYDHIDFSSMQLVAFAEDNANNEAVVAPLDDQRELIAILWAERVVEVAKWEQDQRPKIIYPKPTILSVEQEFQLLFELVKKTKLLKQ